MTSPVLFGPQRRFKQHTLYMFVLVHLILTHTLCCSTSALNAEFKYLFVITLTCKQIKLNESSEKVLTTAMVNLRKRIAEEGGQQNTVV